MSPHGDITSFYLISVIGNSVDPQYPRFVRLAVKPCLFSSVLHRAPG